MQQLWEHSALHGFTTFEDVVEMRHGPQTKTTPMDRAFALIQSSEQH
jgi:hypothetical protein